MFSKVHLLADQLTSGNLTFKCSSSEGAILTMPDGAFREDLRSTTLFRDFAAENAESWYQFINGPCGWELGNGELRLITGCDKTKSWGLAAYQIIQSEGDSSDSLGGPLLRFRNTSYDGDRVPGTTYSWEHEDTAEVKAGPEFEVGEDMPGNGARARNQCTFIRSYTIMLSEAGWARVQSTLSALDSRRAPKSAQPQSTSSSNFLTRALSHLGKQWAPYLQGQCQLRRRRHIWLSSQYRICNDVRLAQSFCCKLGFQLQLI